MKKNSEILANYKLTKGPQLLGFKDKFSQKRKI